MTRLWRRSVAEDICLALQNVGSRVRKSEPVLLSMLRDAAYSLYGISDVMEGYATDRFNASIPATPHSSPTKQPITPSSNNPIFRSANDTLYDVFSSPTRSAFTPSPSPKKRGRADVGPEVEPGVRSDVDPDSEMSGFISDPEDEEVLFVLEPAMSRPIKPLRRPKAGSNQTSFETPHVAVSTNADVCIALPASDSMDEDLDWFSKS